MTCAGSPASCKSRCCKKLMTWYRLTGQDDPKPAFSAIQTFLAVHSHWPKSRTLRRRAEQAIDDQTDPLAVLRFFEDRQPQTARGHIRYAEALLASGLVDQATGSLRHAWRTGNFSRYQQRIFLARHGNRLTGEDHKRRLHQLLWQGARTEAQRMFPLVDDQQVALARARIALQRSSPGVDRFIDAVPQQLLADDGLIYDRVRWRRRKGRDASAQELLYDGPETISRAKEWWRERHIQVRDRLDDGDWQAAYALAAGHRQVQGLGWVEAEWYAGWLALRRLKKPDEALARFEEVWSRVSTPISRARAAYWAGRAAEQLGDEALARTWFARAASYDTAFYGQQAVERGGGTRPPADTSFPPVSAEQRARFDGDELVRLVRFLAQIGDQSVLPAFLRQVLDRTSDREQLTLTIQLAAEVGRPDLMIRASQDLAKQGEVLERASHPVPNLEAMLSPRAIGVSPALMLAVARQESRFQPGVTSPAGARGLMQLLPSTAKAIARRRGIPFQSTRLTSDASYNAEIAGHYLDSLLRQYNGELVLVTAAYNAGPGRVSNWIRRFGDPRGMGPDERLDWIERIPFSETRNYVQRVLEARWVYKRRLTSGAFETVPLAEDPGPIVPPPVPRLKPVTPS